MENIKHTIIEINPWKKEEKVNFVATDEQSIELFSKGSTVTFSKTNSFSVSGTRYADMGLGFKCSGVEEQSITLATDMKARLKELSASDKTDSIYVLVNYTALFPTQAILKELEDKKNGK